MPPKVQKSKAAKMLAATSAAKGKGKKKKWSKGKMREKRDNRVVFNKALWEKVVKEMPKKMKLITIYNVIENYKINGSLRRRQQQQQKQQRSIHQHTPRIFSFRPPFRRIDTGGRGKGRPSRL